jgi:hypothetical protein
MLVQSIIILVLNCIILRYVYELEAKSCKCSLHGQHQFIKYFAPVIIFVSLIGLFVSDKSLITAVQSNTFLGVILSIYAIVSLAYGINLVLYFLKLVYSKCECSRDWKRWGLLYPALGFAIIILMVLVISIAMLLGKFPQILAVLSPKGSSRVNVVAPKSGTPNNTFLNSLKSTVEKGKKAKVSKRK